MTNKEDLDKLSEAEIQLKIEGLRQAKRESAVLMKAIDDEIKKMGTLLEESQDRLTILLKSAEKIEKIQTSAHQGVKNVLEHKEKAPKKEKIRKLYDFILKLENRTNHENDVEPAYKELLVKGKNSMQEYFARVLGGGEHMLRDGILQILAMPEIDAKELDSAIDILDAIISDFRRKYKQIAISDEKLTENTAALNSLIKDLQGIVRKNPGPISKYDKKSEIDQTLVTGKKMTGDPEVHYKDFEDMIKLVKDITRDFKKRLSTSPDAKIYKEVPPEPTWPDTITLENLIQSVEQLKETFKGHSDADYIFTPLVPLYDAAQLILAGSSPTPQVEEINQQLKKEIKNLIRDYDIGTLSDMGRWFAKGTSREMKNTFKNIDRQKKKILDSKRRLKQLEDSREIVQDVKT